ncbi:hypothetical protein ACP70R_004791 [Stipagrostis hirtigluma subsp. patula]
MEEQPPDRRGSRIIVDTPPISLVAGRRPGKGRMPRRARRTSRHKRRESGLQPPCRRQRGATSHQQRRRRRDSRPEERRDPCRGGRNRSKTRCGPQRPLLRGVRQAHGVGGRRRCGHRAVCRKCMVRARFFYGNRRCCICRTRCPKVIVTRSDAGDVLPALLKLPLFTLREGRGGRHWYNKHTAAYFEDEKEYKATKADCEFTFLLTPFGGFTAFYLFFIFLGMGLGRCFATKVDPVSAAVRDSAVGGSIGILLATIGWSILKRFPNTTECV